MKKFEYKGKLLTFKELVKFSVVPEKTLRSRLYSSISLWEVKSAVETPFGKVGKTPEISKADTDVNENKQNKEVLKKQVIGTHIDSKERGHDVKTFICMECGHIKAMQNLGKVINKHRFCIACLKHADEMANRTEQEIKAKQAQYKFNGKQYRDDKGVLFFLTNEEEYKKK